jgi:hypothetical protein
MVEDALCPVEWRYGPLLELGHYFGARASFEHRDMSYDDDSEEARRRHRRATFNIVAHLPVMRLIEMPTFPERRPVQVRLTVEEAETADP